MRLRTFTAHNIPAAMEQIRLELGEEAIIVSSLRLPSGGVQLVVATEENDADEKLQQALFGEQTEQRLESLKALLQIQRTPDILIDRLIQSASPSKRKTPAHLLEDACAAVFTFNPIPVTRTKRAFMFTGPVASGKTIALTKLAVATSLKRLKTGLITLDTKKAGALDQLKAFTSLLKINLRIINNLDAFAQTLAEERLKNDIVFIDSPGLNPWQATDMALLADVKREAEGVEMILTLPAGLDSLESAEIAESFADRGCTRLIATRTDASHTYGNLLYSAHTAGLQFANYGKDASVTDPLHPLSPAALANFIVKNTHHLGQEILL